MRKFVTFALALLASLASLGAVSPVLSISDGNLDDFELYSSDGTPLDPVTEIDGDGFIIRIKEESVKLSSEQGDLVLAPSTIVTIPSLEDTEIYLIDGQLEVSLADGGAMKIYTPTSLTALENEGSYLFISDEETEAVYNFSSFDIESYDALTGKTATITSMSYIDRAVSEEVKEIGAEGYGMLSYAPVVLSQDVHGYTIVMTVDEGTAVIEYPDELTDEDIELFYEYEAEKYGEDVEGITYTLDDGSTTLTVPLDQEVIEENAPALLEDFTEYVEPILAEEEAEAIIEEPAEETGEPVLEEVTAEEELLEEVTEIAEEEAEEPAIEEVAKEILEEETVEEEAVPAVESAVTLSTEVYGYTLSVEVSGNTIVLSYPPVITPGDAALFIGKEVEKYGSFSGVYYAFEAGTTTALITHPVLASMAPGFAPVLLDDFAAFVTELLAPEEEPVAVIAVPVIEEEELILEEPEAAEEETLEEEEPVLEEVPVEIEEILEEEAAEEAEEPVLEEVQVAEPVVISKTLYGYTVTVSVLDSTAVVEYPLVVTKADAVGFFGYEAEKYGSYIDGITYTLADGSAALSFPVSDEVIINNIPAFFDDIVEYVTILMTPAEEEAVVEEVVEEAVEEAAEAVVAPVTVEEEAAAEPVTISKTLYGYTVTVSVLDSTAVVEYPLVVTKADAVGFFKYEAEKYGSYIDGITYTLADGSATLSFPVSDEVIINNIPAFFDDIVEYVTILMTPAEEEAVVEEVVEEAAEAVVAPVTVEEEAAAEPVTISKTLYGYTVTVSVLDSTAVVEYPLVVTKADVVGFFAYEVEKYGSYIDGITYTLADGSATLNFPVSDEVIINNIPAFFDDIVEYVTILMTPASEEEEVVEETVEETVAGEAAVEAAFEPVVITESVYGYTLKVTINEDTVVLEYPSIVTQEDAAGFFAYEVEKYGADYLSGIYYVTDEGSSILTIPENVTAEAAASYVPVLVDDIVEFVTVLTVPSASEEVIIVSETITEVAIVGVVIPAVPEKVVVTETVFGYTLTATVSDDEVVLEYPLIVTQSDAAGFFAYEVEKYGADYLAGIYYTLDDGSATLITPESVTTDTAVSAVPVLVDDIVEYVAVLLAPVEEEAAEEPAAPELISVQAVIYGYPVGAYCQDGLAIIVYPSVVTDDDALAFFNYEIDKYGDAVGGVLCLVEEDMTYVLVPGVPAETLAGYAPALFEDIEEYVSLLLAPAAEEEAAIEPAAVPSAPSFSGFRTSLKDEPVIISKDIMGMTLTVSVHGSTAVVSYPLTVTQGDAADFYAYEAAKYGSYIDGITYKLSEGSTELYAPVEETVIVANVPVFFADIEEYIAILSAPSEEAVAVAKEPVITGTVVKLEDTPVVISKTIYGYTMTVSVLDSAAVVEYPLVVTQDDAASFFSYEAEKYGSAVEGITYKLSEGSAELDIPVQDEVIVANVPVFFSDVEEYVNLLLSAEEEEPVAEVEEPQVRVPSAPQVKLIPVYKAEIEGIEIKVKIEGNTLYVSYPEIITTNDAALFYAYEIVKYSQYVSGFSFTLAPGSSTLTVPVEERILRKTAQLFFNDIEEYALSVLYPVAEEEEVALEEEALPEIEEEEQVPEPKVFSRTISGHEITVSVLGSTAIVEYPEVITQEDAALFYAYEAGKYGSSVNGVTYSLSDGATTLSVPADEAVIISNVPVFFDDIGEYIESLQPDEEDIELPFWFDGSDLGPSADPDQVTVEEETVPSRAVPVEKAPVKIEDDGLSDESIVAEEEAAVEEAETGEVEASEEAEEEEEAATGPVVNINVTGGGDSSSYPYVIAPVVIIGADDSASVVNINVDIPKGEATAPAEKKDAETVTVKSEVDDYVFIVTVTGNKAVVDYPVSVSQLEAAQYLSHLVQTMDYRMQSSLDGSSIRLTTQLDEDEMLDVFLPALLEDLEEYFGTAPEESAGEDAYYGAYDDSGTLMIQERAPEKAEEEKEEEKNHFDFDLILKGGASAGEDGTSIPEIALLPVFTYGDFSAELSLDAYALYNAFDDPDWADKDWVDWLDFAFVFINEIKYDNGKAGIGVDRYADMAGDPLGLLPYYGKAWYIGPDEMTFEHYVDSFHYAHRVYIDDLTFNNSSSGDDYRTAVGGADIRLRFFEDDPWFINLGAVMEINADDLGKSILYPEIMLTIPLVYSGNDYLAVSLGGATMLDLDDMDVNPFTENGYLASVGLPVKFKDFGLRVNLSYQDGDVHYASLGSSAYEVPVKTYTDSNGETATKTYDDTLTYSAEAYYRNDLFGVKLYGMFDGAFDDFYISGSDFAGIEGYVNLKAFTFFAGFRAQDFSDLDDSNIGYYLGLKGDLGPVGVYAKALYDDGWWFKASGSLSLLGKNRDKQEDTFTGGRFVTVAIETGMQEYIYTDGDHFDMPVALLTPVVTIGGGNASIGFKVPLRMTIDDSGKAVIQGNDRRDELNFGVDTDYPVYNLISDIFSLIDQVTLRTASGNVWLLADSGYIKNSLLFNNYGARSELALRFGVDIEHFGMGFYVDDLVAPRMTELMFKVIPTYKWPMSVTVSLAGETLWYDDLDDFIGHYYPGLELDFPVTKEISLSAFAYTTIDSSSASGYANSFIYDSTNDEFEDWMTGAAFKFAIDHLSLSFTLGYRDGDILRPDMFNAVMYRNHYTLSSQEAHRDQAMFLKFGFNLGFKNVDLSLSYSIDDLILVFEDGFEDVLDIFSLGVDWRVTDVISVWAHLSMKGFVDTIANVDDAVDDLIEAVQDVWSIGVDFNFEHVSFSASLQADTASSYPDYQVFTNLSVLNYTQYSDPAMSLKLTARVTF